MSLPFLRPSPPPSASYLRSFLRNSGRVGVARSSRQLSRSDIYRRAYSSSSPSDAHPTGPPAAADTKPKTAPAPSSTADVSSPPPIPSTDASTAPASPSRPLESLPYFVRRTASQNLPVYHSLKAGGTLKETLVRRIDGDKDALRKDLLDRLPAGIVKKPEHIKINQLTGHIIIKGHVAKEVAGVLRGLHF